MHKHVLLGLALAIALYPIGMSAKADSVAQNGSEDTLGVASADLKTAPATGTLRSTIAMADVAASELPSMTGARSDIALAWTGKKVFVTAYTSVPEETDDTPFTTASGSHTRDGVIAANFLPFGTKVRIPELFGSKVFTVEDRMAKRNARKMDVWMPTKSGALRFGIRYAAIEIVESPVQVAMR